MNPARPRIERLPPPLGIGPGRADPLAQILDPLVAHLRLPHASGTDWPA
jgi:hypothetical protein